MMSRSADSEAPAGHLQPGDSDYPTAVRQLMGNRAPPLWFRGNCDLLNEPGVGFCGSRHASAKGLLVAQDAAGQIAEAGLVVVSGNAAGVDLHAHLAALEAGGTTILVLPEGIEHFRIRREFKSEWDWSRVLVLSQYEPSAPWKAYRAMERNRLIIALARAMMVIEAGATGGTLDAGLATLRLGLPLFVASYEDMETRAPGNATLVGLGGKAVGWNRRTGRASIAAILNAITGPHDAEVTHLPGSMGTLL